MENLKSLAHDKHYRIKELLHRVKTEADPRNSYIELGLELVKTGMTDQALLCFRKANAIREDYLSLYNAASLLYLKNDFKNAILMLEKSRKLKPDFIMTSILAGISYSRLNNFRAAETNFINTLMLDPVNRTALTALSILYHNQGRMTESFHLVGRINALYETGKSFQKLKKGLIKHNVSLNTVKCSDYNAYISSLPVSIYNDKYGTIEEKIGRLETSGQRDRDSLISLSLCHMFSGDTDSAIEYLFEAKNCKAS